MTDSAIKLMSFILVMLLQFCGLKSLDWTTPTQMTQHFRPTPFIQAKKYIYPKNYEHSNKVSIIFFFFVFGPY